MAMSYYNQIPDVTRDQERSEKALAAVAGARAQKYPKSEYADDAKYKIQVARDQLAGKEMEIGRFYLERAQLHRRDQPLQRGGRASTRRPATSRKR